MAVLFISLIYVTFIGLGLPDAMLGSAWTVMRLTFDMPTEAAGFVSVLTAGCTVISSLMCDTMVRRLGTGKTVSISVFLTALALAVQAISPAYWLVVLMAIPLGLGAGCIDAALNNYVALHYSARHMNWLHCSWGIGAFLGPQIIAYFISNGNNWRGGFLLVAAVLLLISIAMLVSLPMWKKQEKNHIAPKISRAAGKQNVLKLKGVLPSMMVFLAYCAAEWTIGLWASSYLVDIKNLEPAAAAQGVSLFFLGIFGGRFLSGLITSFLSSKNLIRSGLFIMFLGVVLLLLPLSAVLAMVGILLIGIGLAPIFPTMIHETPERFGKEYSQRIVSLQMASAYVGNTVFPPLLGVIAAIASLSILPFFVAICCVVMLGLSEYVNRIIKSKQATDQV